MNAIKAISTNPTLASAEVKSADQGDRIKQLAQDFESIFLELLTSNMRKTVPTSGFMSGGNGEDIFRSMLDTEYAKSLAAQNITGIADTLAKQLGELAGVKVGDKDITSQKALGLKAYALQTLRPSLKQGKIGE